MLGRLALLAAQARQARNKGPLEIAPDLLLDRETRELRVRGLGVHLRPREFALLEVLAQHPGRTFPRQQLLEAVGVGTSGRDMSTIDVHVRWLSEKLGPSFPARLITVRGVGYRLERGVNETLTMRQRSVDPARRG